MPAALASSVQENDNTEGFLSFLSEINSISLRNTNPKDIEKWAMKRPNFSHVELGGNHPIAVFQNKTGGQFRIPLSNPHKGAIPIGTVKSIIVQFLSTNT